MITAFMVREQFPSWRARVAFLLLVSASVFPIHARAQVNSGSDGHDGAFNPTTNTVIDMTDHPDGIYHYTSVNVSNGITVTFIPNANNTPVVWLVQGDCNINGTIMLSGRQGADGGQGGPGGFRGGNPGGSGASAETGQGPGGGGIGDENVCGGNASFGTVGDVGFGQGFGQGLPGEVYGNSFLLPLLGGSGGAGLLWYKGGAFGGGGGGAFLLAVSGTTRLQGNINASGGNGSLGVSWYDTPGSGGGSGGAIRIITTRLTGNGSITTGGGSTPWYRWSWCGCTWNDYAGKGRVRLDAMENTFVGTISGTSSRGYQPIIIPPPNQAVSLSILSVAGVTVAENPTGSLSVPDVIVASNQQNPIPIVVHCVNVPLHSEIIVELKPANGTTVRAVGLNSTGTQASSTATVSINMPRGGGTIQAKAVSGIDGNLYGTVKQDDDNQSLAATGWTANGERFAAVEVTTTISGSQHIAYLTESGKRYTLPSLN